MRYEGIRQDSELYDLDIFLKDQERLLSQTVKEDRERIIEVKQD